MPSLITNNRHNAEKIATFEYCMPDPTEIASPKCVVKVLKQLALSMFLYLVAFGANGIIDFLGSHNHHMYNSYNLSAIWNYIYPIFGSFFCFTFVMVYLSNFYHTKHEYYNGLILSFCIYIVINGTILYFITVDGTNPTKHKGWSETSLFDFGCDWLECENINVYYSYFGIFIPIFSPLFHCFLIFFIIIVRFHCFKSNVISNLRQTFELKKKHKKDKKRNTKKKAQEQQQQQQQIEQKQKQKQKQKQLQQQQQQLETGRNDLNRSLNPHIQQYRYSVSFSSNSNENTNDSLSNDYLQRLKRDMSVNSKEMSLPAIAKKIYEIKISLLGYMFCFWIIWGVFNFGQFLSILLRENIYKNHWDYWFYYWLLLTSINKWILKKIGRKIDQKRIQLLLVYNITNDESEMKLYSIEWFVEILMSLKYWNAYRTNLVFFLIYQPWGVFFSTIISHLISEFIETSIKLSKYFWKQMQIYQNITKYDNLCFGGICKLIRMQIYDDSKYIEWTMRQTVDIVLRFLVSNITVIWWFMFSLSMPHFYNLSTKYEIISIVYTLISYLSEFGYFVIALYLHYKYHKQNLFAYYYQVFEMYQIWFIMSWLASTLVVKNIPHPL